MTIPFQWNPHAIAMHIARSCFILFWYGMVLVNLTSQIKHMNSQLTSIKSQPNKTGKSCTYIRDNTDIMIEHQVIGVVLNML